MSFSSGTICSVAICDSNNTKARRIGEPLMFHTFPKDPAIRDEWAKRCYRKDHFTPENKKICSKHFKSSDYEDEMRARIMGEQPRKLKSDAIPSLLLIPETPIEEEVLAEKKKGRRRKAFQFVPDEPKTGESEKLEAEVKENKEEIKQLKKENLWLQDFVASKEAEVSSLKVKLKEVESGVNIMDFSQRAKTTFKDFLSANQIDIAIGLKKWSTWTLDDLSKGFTLYYLSAECYNYLKDTLKYPLPSVSTMRRWVSNIDLRSGILNDVLSIMSAFGRSKGIHEKLTVISFDEIKVQSVYEYDPKNDEIVGPHSYMQVVMARGLFSKWKQPVYIGFDKQIDATVLNDVIIKLNEIEFDVVACVTDAGRIETLWEELEVDLINPSFPHPVTKEPIFMFADAPHLLQLLQNWFIIQGFLLGDGTVINAGLIQALLSETFTETASSLKLTPLHMKHIVAQRKNVNSAAQLFSNSTAAALLSYESDKNKQLARDVGMFVQLVNGWFDIMNSNSPATLIPSKTPYGLLLEDQDKTLEKMKEIMGNIRCVVKNSDTIDSDPKLTNKQVFQRGIIMSIKSLQFLLRKILEGARSFNVKLNFILTRRLNLRCLEHFFSLLQSNGKQDDYLTPLQCVNHVRTIIFKRYTGVSQNHKNVGDDSEECLEENNFFATSCALKKAGVYVDGNKEPEKPEIQEILLSNSVYQESSLSLCTESDGLLYVAGYLASKHITDHPGLGKYSDINGIKSLVALPSDSLPIWAKSLSSGGLVVPTDEWMKKVEGMEQSFLEFHKDSFKEGVNVIKKTVEYVSQKKGRELIIPNDLIKSFCQVRTFVRINYLNMLLKQKKNLKRKNDAEETITDKKK